jgi:hypothetical protein
MSDPICKRCEHPLSEHCKGGVRHADHKEEARMVPLKYRKGTVTCISRHCENPLCSCVDFIEETFSNDHSN